MESFLEPARAAPEPTQIEKYVFSPAVPEVSMINNTKTSLDNFSSQENAWKMRREKIQGSQNLPTQQGFIPSGYRNLQAQFAKKQVRFEFQHIPQLSEKLLCDNNIESSSSYSSFNAIRRRNMSEGPSNKLEPFEQIYMANIPDRQLDLSLIDLPNVANSMKKMNIIEKTTLDEQSSKNKIDERDIHKNSQKVGELSEENDKDIFKNKCVKNKENQIPITYHDFLDLQKKINAKRKLHNDSITDIFNYKRNNSVNQQNDFPVQSKPIQVDNATNSCKLDIQQKPIFDTSNFHPYVSSFQALQTYKPFVHAPLVKQKCDTETQTYCEDLTESKALENRTNCEPNNTDLLKIIARQNEHILILQKQLLERYRNYPKLKEASEQDRENCDRNKCATASTPQKNHFRQENTITKQASIFQDNQRKWGMSKFSINVTTSFDMSIRGQQKQNFINNEPQIQEITESDFSQRNENLLEQSIHFQEPLNIRQPSPSPQPSVHINMDEYESSDDEISSSEMGATFYNNLLDQVNKIKKAQIETEGRSEGEIRRKRALNKEITESDFSQRNENILEQSIHFQEPLNIRQPSPSPHPSVHINMDEYESSDDEISSSEMGATFYNNLLGQVNKIKKAQIETEGMSEGEIRRKRALNKAREATLNHLKVMGNTVDQVDLVSSENIRNYNPSEISRTAKQLLMKYLPKDQLKQHEKVRPIQKGANNGILEPRPEFSVACLEYMKKYNLISSAGKVPQITQPQKFGQNQCDYMDNNNRILDSTLLKMQP